MSPVRLANRNPFETIIVAGAAVTNFPGALGLAPPPPSVATQLGPFARWWLVSIFLAGLTTFVGLMMESPSKLKISVNALVVEQIGCVAIAWSCVLWAGAAYAQSGWDGLTGSGWIALFALAGFNQAFKIQNVLRSLRGLPPWRPVLRLLKFLHLDRRLRRWVR